MVTLLTSEFVDLFVSKAIKTIVAVHAWYIYYLARILAGTAFVVREGNKAVGFVHKLRARRELVLSVSFLDGKVL